MSLSYLLDTNICIYIAKQKPLTVLKKFQKLEVGQVGMSVITYGELMYGISKSKFAKQAQYLLVELTELINVVEISESVGSHYGDIRAALEKKGRPIGNNDLWIAAHARALEVTLVTNNMKELQRVPKLEIENWV